MNFWDYVDTPQAKERVRRVLMSSDPYGKHPYTRESLVGTSYSASVRMPESRLRMLRRLCRTTGKRGTIGPAIIGTRVELACGDGLSLTATPRVKNPDKIREIAEGLWSAFTSDNVSSCGLFDIHSLVRGGAESAHHNGDCFVVSRYSKAKARKTGFGTCLEVIPGAAVCNPNGRTNGNRLWNGIEYDSNWRALYIHYIKRIDDRAPVWGKINVATERFVIIDTPLRQEAGINRPIPLLAPVLDEINLLETFRKAYITKAVNNSKLTFVTEGLPNLDYDVDTLDEFDSPSFTKIEDGTLIKAPPGATVKPIAEVAPSSDAVNFSKAYAAEVASTCFIPIEILLKSFDKSYSAGTGSLNECWRIVKIDRKIVSRIYQLAYSSILEESWANGNFPATAFGNDKISRLLYSSASWNGQPRGSLNPLADYRAREIAEDRGWTTGAINAAELGFNRAENIEIRRREAQELRDINGEE